MGNLIEALCTTCAEIPETNVAEEKAFGESWH